MLYAFSLAWLCVRIVTPLRAVTTSSTIPRPDRVAQRRHNYALLRPIRPIIGTVQAPDLIASINVYTYLPKTRRRRSSSGRLRGSLDLSPLRDFENSDADKVSEQHYSADLDREPEAAADVYDRKNRQNHVQQRHQESKRRRDFYHARSFAAGDRQCE